MHFGLTLQADPAAILAEERMAMTGAWIVSQAPDARDFCHIMIEWLPKQELIGVAEDLCDRLSVYTSLDPDVDLDRLMDQTPALDDPTPKLALPS